MTKILTVILGTGVLLFWLTCVIRGFQIIIERDPYLD
jgi:hypothetical protein